MASTALASAGDIRAFIDEYFEAWSGTDEDRILSYYAETVSLEIPGMRHERKDGRARPICPPLHRRLSRKPSHREEHDLRQRRSSLSNGASKPITRDHSRAVQQPARAVKLPGCGVYEFDPVNSKDHRGPYLLRRHNVTETDFITPTSGVAEPSHCRGLLRGPWLAASTPSFGAEYREIGNRTSLNRRP